MKMTLGGKLKQLRNIKGLTLRDVEEKTGISNGYLNQLEQDKIKKPSPHILHTLAEFYDFSYPSFLNLAGYIVPHGIKISGFAFSRKNLTPDEEEELLKYLEFIRLKKRSKG
jgi:transcriptional regulator with XRE-family HTH domain